MILLAAEVTRSSKTVMDKILKLYVRPGALIYDVTYCKGNFWTEDALRDYIVLGSDITPCARIVADFRCLPYHDASADCVVLDPPFGCLSTVPRRDDIANQYDLMVVGGEKGLLQLYKDGLAEAVRVVCDNGLIIVKCQNGVNSGKKQWIGLDIKDMGVAMGLQAVDWALQINESPPEQHGKRIQRHLRENMTIWWVFRKPKLQRRYKR